MEKIILSPDLAHAKAKIHRENWTAIIAAAGKGSRLQSPLPKILYPIAQKPILYWLVELLTPFCAHFVFVVSPEGKGEIAKEVEKLKIKNFQLAIQEKANGMADAVNVGIEKVKTENTLVVWGDQVALRPQTVQTCIAYHEANPQVPFTLPTFQRRNPYIHFERGTGSKKDKIISVLQKREGDVLPETGESDSGIFFFKTYSLREQLKLHFQDPKLLGAKTKEVNFLPLFPFFENSPPGVLTLRILSEEEAMGVNTPEEAEILSRLLEAKTWKK